VNLNAGSLVYLMHGDEERRGSVEQSMSKRGLDSRDTQYTAPASFGLVGSPFAYPFAC
jgi:hypothetical protein